MLNIRGEKYKNGMGKSHPIHFVTSLCLPFQSKSKITQNLNPDHNPRIGTGNNLRLSLTISSSYFLSESASKMISGFHDDSFHIYFGIIHVSSYCQPRIRNEAKRPTKLHTPAPSRLCFADWADVASEVQIRWKKEDCALTACGPPRPQTTTHSIDESFARWADFGLLLHSLIFFK